MTLYHALTDHKEGTEFGVIRDDFNRRYSDTYMILAGTNLPESLYYIEGLRGDGSLTYLSWDTGDRYHLNYKDITLLKPWHPTPGYYQINSRCIYLNKRVSRQWRRSFSSSTYSYDLDHNKVILLYRSSLQPNKVYSLDDIDEDSPKIKLTDSLACGWSDAVNSLVIFYEDHPIAKVKPDSKKIKPLVDAFKQELLDYIKRFNLLKWEVK